jgi:hypothetical protein
MLAKGGDSSMVFTILGTEFFLVFFLIYFFIHMCIQCLGHFSPLPPPPPLLPNPPPPSPAHPLDTRQNGHRVLATVSSSWREHGKAHKVLLPLLSPPGPGIVSPGCRFSSSFWTVSDSFLSSKKESQHNFSTEFLKKLCSHYVFSLNVVLPTFPSTNRATHLHLT